MKISVNEKNVLRLLADAFTNRTSYILELMQNARRAGAKQIHFGINTKDKTLTVTDDGIGIEDFEKLLVQCESGWGGEIQESDRPYGVGFLSAIMASTKFQVTSRGMRMTAVTEQLLNGQSAELNRVHDGVERGTEIVLWLKNGTDDIEGKIAVAARTFPIDVYLGFRPLPRPCALDTAKYKKEIPGVGTLAWSGALTSLTISLALQGLPITAEDRGWMNTTSDWTLHLDQSKFTGRMPDRDLVKDFAYMSVQASVMDAAADILDDWVGSLCGAPNLQEYLFIEASGSRRLKYVKVLPPGCFGTLRDEPTTHLERGMKFQMDTVWEEYDVNTLPHYLIVDLSPEGTDGLAVLRVAYATDTPILQVKCLPPWAGSKELEVDYVEFIPLNQSQRWSRISLSGDWPYVDVVSCEAVELRLMCEDEVVLSHVVTDKNIVDGSTIYMTSSEADSETFQQFCEAYEEGGSYFDYEKIDRAVVEFNRELLLRRNSDPTDYLKSALDGVWRKELNGTTFLIRWSSSLPTVVEVIPPGADLILSSLSGLSSPQLEQVQQYIRSLIKEQ